MQSWNKLRKVFKVRHICQWCNDYYKVRQIERWSSRLVLSKYVAHTYYFDQYSTLNALDFFQCRKVLKALRIALKGLLFREPPAFVIVFKYFDLECNIRLTLSSVRKFQLPARTKYNKIDLTDLGFNSL